MGIIGGHELSDMGAKNWTLVFCKSSKHSYPDSFLQLNYGFSEN